MGPDGGRRNGILLHGLFLYAATGALAFAAAAHAPASGYHPSDAVAIPYVLALFALATVLLLFALRSPKTGKLVEALFALAILSGIWFLADAFLPSGAALLIGSLAILLRYRWKRVASLNGTLAAGIAGLAAALGTQLSANAFAILLTLLSFYDIFAVYATGHMTRIFRGLAGQGTLLAFALTEPRPKALLSPLAGPDAPPAMYLGSGDVALPLLLAVAAFRLFAPAGGFVLAGALAGFALIPRLARRRPAPLPALPPIAAGALLGYLMSLLIFPAT